MKRISRVEISLDDNVPEYMEGIIRIGSVRYEYEDIDNTDQDEKEEEEDDDDEFVEIDLVDNKEFYSEGELIDYVANKLNISSDCIEISE